MIKYGLKSPGSTETRLTERTDHTIWLIFPMHQRFFKPYKVSHSATVLKSIYTTLAAKKKTSKSQTESSVLKELQNHFKNQFCWLYWQVIGTKWNSSRKITVAAWINRCLDLNKVSRVDVKRYQHRNIFCIQFTGDSNVKWLREQYLATQPPHWRNHTWWITQMLHQKLAANLMEIFVRQFDGNEIVYNFSRQTELFYWAPRGRL